MISSKLHLFFGVLQVSHALGRELLAESDAITADSGVPDVHITAVHASINVSFAFTFEIFYLD